jgi:hypothetical protein
VQVDCPPLLRLKVAAGCQSLSGSQSALAAALALWVLSGRASRRRRLLDDQRQLGPMAPR